MNNPAEGAEVMTLIRTRTERVRAEIIGVNRGHRTVQLRFVYSGVVVRASRDFDDVDMPDGTPPPGSEAPLPGAGDWVSCPWSGSGRIEGEVSRVNAATASVAILIERDEILHTRWFPASEVEPVEEFAG